MPRKKNQHQRQPFIDDFPDPVDLDFGFHQDDVAPEPAPEPEIEPPRQSRKKIRNVHTKTSRFNDYSLDTIEAGEIAPSEPSLSPPNDRLLLDQVEFPSRTKSKPVDIREDIGATQKVSDQYTPPSDAGLTEEIYGKSPVAAATTSNASTPPVEPGFSVRKPYKVSSPFISPAQHSVRPVSFGGTPLPAYARPASIAYGSPPAPHLPQPHFYGAYDVNLALPPHASVSTSRTPTFVKFVKLPGLGQSIVSGSECQIQLYTYNGVELHEVAVLGALPGTPVDAEVLTSNSTAGLNQMLRPLIAITLMHVDPAPGGLQQCRFSVSVYSLSQCKHIADLLHTAPQVVCPTVPGYSGLDNDYTNRLRLKAEGAHLIISSAVSGELYVFRQVDSTSGSAFECIRKLWTAIQPKELQRAPSHTRPNVSGGIGSTPPQLMKHDDVPIFSICGRWLAICPPTSAPQAAANVLGEGVLVNRSAELESTGPGNRPSVNCDVDSPDADTTFGRVARGMAKEMYKASRWLGEQGMQAWQNYWNKEDASAGRAQQPLHNDRETQRTQYGGFPPTHADARPARTDPELVAIYDLQSLHETSNRKVTAHSPLATFRPPNGCSFLAFAPNGLVLLTASRKGDHHYVWDLMQMKHSRIAVSEAEARNAPRVRQLVRYDRVGESTVVDVVWDLPTMSRFALLTKNKTVHLFDLPASAMRWPPPRNVKKPRPLSAPPTDAVDTIRDPAPSGGFLASAMNFAGRTQPVLSNFRGRAPSNSGGLSGIGQAGFGFAAATGARGSKAVASGLSKSLGAAVDTVSKIHHAGKTRLHLNSDIEVSAGSLTWTRRAGKAGIVVLGQNGVKYYQVRKSKPRDSRQPESTVFDARRGVSIRLPDSTSLEFQHTSDQGLLGYFKQVEPPIKESGRTHPLSFAEIDTNAPFQPFHSDRRVTISLFATEQPDVKQAKKAKKSKPEIPDNWVFGDPIPAYQLGLNQQLTDVDEITGSVIYRETTVANNIEGEHIVSTTRRRKAKSKATPDRSQDEEGEAAQEGFFEDDCDVLDFAGDRV